MKYRLGDICTITKGAIGIMKAIAGSYTMITLGEIEKTHNEYQFDAKAVIIPLVSSTGHGHASMKRVKYCEGKFALGNILCAVIPNDESFVLAKYLHIYLHWNREELLVSQMKGMANVSLPMNRIVDVMVPVPSIEKQIQIIELEKQLAQKELFADGVFTRQLSLLDNLNQAILQEAVQGKLVPQDPKEEPAGELLKRIKAEKATLRQAQGSKKVKELPSIKPEEIPFQIPDNWVWCRIEEVFYTIGSKNNQVQSKEYCEIGKFPIIDQGYRYIIGYSNDESKVLRIKKPVIVFGDHTKNIKFIDFDFVVGADGTKILANYDYIFEKWFYFYLKSINLENKGYSRHFKLLKKHLIPLPPLSEQKRIVAEIEKQLEKTQQLKAHILSNKQATEQLLKALLQGAFEGEEKEN